MNVRYLADAKRDLDRIVSYIARDNPAAAYRVRDAIMERGTQLVGWPEIGPAGRRAGTRELVVTRYPYILVYRIHRREIRVLRVLHDAQQWPPTDPTTPAAY